MSIEIKELIVKMTILDKKEKATESITSVTDLIPTIQEEVKRICKEQIKFILKEQKER